jgi:hypothetical protein
LMSEAAYRSLLVTIEAKLPEWGAAFDRIDPSKTNLSYAVGEQVVLYRNIGLMQIDNAAKQIKQERDKHSVARELWLHASLQGIYDSIDALTLLDPSVDFPVEKYVRELSVPIFEIGNDSHARVELLEKGTCP